MLDRLAVFYTDMDAIKEFIKTDPHAALGIETEEHSEPASPRSPGKKKSPHKGSPTSPSGLHKKRGARAGFGNTSVTVSTQSHTQSVYDGAL